MRWVLVQIPNIHNYSAYPRCFSNPEYPFFLFNRRVVESFVYVESMNHAFFKPHQDIVVKSYSKMSVSYATNCKHQQQNQQTENTHRHTEKNTKDTEKHKKRHNKRWHQKYMLKLIKWVSVLQREEETERERYDAFRAGCGSWLLILWQPNDKGLLLTDVRHRV